jgi:hypothetical protein
MCAWIEFFCHWIQKVDRSRVAAFRSFREELGINDAAALIWPLSVKPERTNVSCGAGTPQHTED